MKRGFLILLLGAAATLLGQVSYQYWQDRYPPRVDFTLKDLTGMAHAAADYDGQLVLLNFWAPWCAPCRAEIPMLNELQKEYGPRGLQILGPALDQAEAIERFMVQTPILYPVLLGMPDILRLQDAYGEQRLPFSILISMRGRVLFRHAGELQKNQITPLIEQNL